MNSWPLGIPSDQACLWGVNILLQATMAAAISLTIAMGVRRFTTLRYGVLLAGFVWILLSPLLAGMLQWSGRSWSLSVMHVAVPPASASGAMAPAKATEMAATSWLPESQEAFDGSVREGVSKFKDEREAFTESSSVFVDERQKRPNAVADRRPPFRPASSASPEVSQANFSNPSLSPTYFGAAVRMAVPPLSIVWLTGSAILLAKLIVNCRRLASILHAARPNTEPAIDELFAQTGRALQVQKLPELVLSDRASGPFSAGVFRPRIVLPARIVGRVTPEQLHDILVHEVAHVVRRDQAIMLLQNVVNALFWFHPLVKVLNRQLARASEEICDNYVLAATDAPAYSRTLLTLTQFIQSSTPAPAAVGLFTSRWKLETRVAGLLDDRRSRGTRLTGRGRLFVGVVAVAQAAVPAFGTLSVAEEGVNDAAPQASATNQGTNEPGQTVPDDEPPLRKSHLSSEDRATSTEADALPKGAIFRLGTDRFRQAGEIQDVQYSRDGKKLASISRDSIIIWNAGDGRRLRRFRSRREAAFSENFSAMSFSPDGEEIAALGRSRIYIWEMDTGLELLSFHVDSDAGTLMDSDIKIIFSPDGKQLAVTAGLSVLLFDTTTGKQTTKLSDDGHQAFLGVSWTPDGTCLSSATLEPAVVTWNVETGKLVRRFEAKKGRVFSRCPIMSADGKLLLASTGGVIDVWRFASGEHLKKIETDADFINTLALTPDQKTLIVGSQDGNIRIVDFEQDKVLRTIEGGLWLGRSMAVSPDFKTVALGAVFPTIRQWDIETGEEKFPEFTSRGHDAEVECAAYSPDGRIIASGGSNHQINLWAAQTGKLLRRLPSESSANRMAFAPSGRHLLTSWKNAGVIRVWEVATGKLLKTIDSGRKKVRSFALSSDGKELVCVVSDSKYGWHSPIGEEAFQTWDLESGEKRREFKFATASTESATLTKGGTTLVTGAANGIIHVMDIKSGEELTALPGHQHSVNSLAFSPDGALLVSASTDQTIRIWDAKTWKNLRVLKGHKRAVTSLAFAPNGVLASAGGTRSYPLAPENPQTIRIWNVQTGEQVGAFSGHDANTSSIAFAPDGQRLVSAHDNTTLLLWDIQLMNSQ